MNRVLAVIFFLALAGCAVPQEREALKPLSDKTTTVVYADLFSRARLQAAAALEAFYADNWLELEQTAQVLEQTARYLPKATELPAHLKKNIEQESESLRQQAMKLGDSARGKNVKSANENLQRIHLTIRTLRPTE